MFGTRANILNKIEITQCPCRLSRLGLALISQNKIEITQCPSCMHITLEMKHTAQEEHAMIFLIIMIKNFGMKNNIGKHVVWVLRDIEFELEALDMKVKSEVD